MIPEENEDKLYEGNSENWYKYLYQRMRDDCDLSNFQSNNISFITFNYDRSLEQFLFTSLKNSYSKLENAKCCEIISKINILHLHGKLGSLPSENIELLNEFSNLNYNSQFSKDENGKYCRAYNSEINYRIVKNSIRDLKIIHDDLNVKVFTRAIKLLEDSERIYILGFGFHSISLKRLRISELKNKLIAGTAFKMGKMEVNRVATQLDMNLLNERLHNCNIIEFFREHCSLS